MSLPNVSYTVDENKTYYNPYKLPEYTIEYTSTDGKVIVPKYSNYITTPFLDADGNEIPIASNTYENGKGKIILHKEPKTIIGFSGGGETDSWFIGTTNKLESIAIPDSITTIGKCAFADTALKKIRISDPITSIGGKAFYSCDELTHVVILNSVADVYGGAFDKCGNLKAVYIDSPVLLHCSPYLFNGCFNLEALIFAGQDVCITNSVDEINRDYNQLFNPDSASHGGDLTKLKIYAQSNTYDYYFYEYMHLYKHADKGASYNDRDELLSLVEQLGFFDEGLLNEEEIIYVI